MDKLEEARKLAVKVEVAHDELDAREREFALLCSPWDSAISVLHKQIRRLAELREADPAVADRRTVMALLEQDLYTLKNALSGLANDLINAEAFFPSGAKSQILTDRITLKSQMPSLPTVVDDMGLVESLVGTGRLREFAKSVSIKLDNDMAEAIKRWFIEMDTNGYSVGLEMPQPKILNIKVKPKEES